MGDDFERARALFIEGVRAFESGHATQARDCFEASLALVPGRPSTLVNLAATHIRLGVPDTALPLLDQVLQAEPGNSDAWAYRGAALADLEHYDEALACQERVLAAEPQHRAAAFERAALLNVLGRHRDALDGLDALLRDDVDHAPSWIEHGHTLHALERPEEALRSYKRALALDGVNAEAWSQYGGVLKDLGRLDAAAHAFRQALAFGSDAEVDGFMLASVQPEAMHSVPTAPPRAYVLGLFDQYAERFDEHLLRDLAYRAPQVLCGLLPPGRRYRAALDLGCGTGLSALPLQGLADAIDGIDLSPRMLDKARQRGLYRELLCGELTELLQSRSARYELVLAADVFIYVGALDAVFAAVAQVLEPGGHFALSLEEAQSGLELRASSRYAHSERYVRDVAAAAGLVVLQVERGTIREEQQRPIEGLFALLGHG